MNSRDYQVIGVVLVIFGIYAGVLLWNIWPIQEISVAKSGVFGDSFGPLTALFSGLAFSGLLITIFYQREDLGLTKEELRLTREEIKSQHLETTFFHMLRLQQDIVSGIDLQRPTEGGQQETNGRDCFKVFVKRLQRNYQDEMKVNPARDEQLLADAAYEQLWAKSQSDLGHYFRSLYNVFRYVSEHEFTDRKQYGSIARAQLSDFELVVLFYNCINVRGTNFVRFAEEFEIFDNLDASLLMKPEHVGLLPAGVFGENQQALTIHSDAIATAGR